MSSMSRFGHDNGMEEFHAFKEQDGDLFFKHITKAWQGIDHKLQVQHKNCLGMGVNRDDIYARGVIR